jgi:acyl-CoA synthetase (AMP-forming)/AMP-acid ligase II
MIVPTATDVTTKQLRDHLFRYRVNQFFAAPAQVHDLIQQFGSASFPDTMRCLMLGSAPVTSGFLSKLSGIYQGDTWCIYGMTEILPVATVAAATKIANREPGDLLGDPVPGATLRIAADGELIVSGSSLCIGYLGQPPLHEVATGDIVKTDSRGRLVLLGRKKDMIIRREYNIYPSLYESTISKVPGVEACALVGRYNEAISDEEVVLFVEGQIDAGKLRRLLTSGEYSIDKTALPDEIIVIPAIPRIGRQQKPDKNKLRDMAQL